MTQAIKLYTRHSKYLFTSYVKANDLTKKQREADNELIKEAERKYRESLGNPEREGEKEILTNIQEQNIQVILMLIFIIILFCFILYKLHK